MKRYSVFLALAAILAFCRAAPSSAAEISISPGVWATRICTIYYLRAEAGKINLVIMRPRKFSTGEFDSFSRTAYGLDIKNLGWCLKESVEKNIPVADQGGKFCFRLNEPFWEYRSPAGTLYFLKAGLEDRQAIANGQWVKRFSSGTENAHWEILMRGEIR